MIIETVFRSLVAVGIAPRAAGDLITADVVVPADAPDGSLLRLAIDMLAADRINPAISFDIEFQRRLAPNWLLMTGLHWTGVDAIDDETGNIYIPKMDIALVTGGSDGQGGRISRNKRGWRIRGFIHLPQALSLGWRIEVITQV